MLIHMCNVALIHTASTMGIRTGSGTTVLVSLVLRNHYLLLTLVPATLFDLKKVL